MTPIAQILSADHLNKFLPTQPFSHGLTGYMTTEDSRLQIPARLNTKSMNQIVGHVYTAVLALFILWIAQNLHDIHVSSLIRGLALLMSLPVALYFLVPGQERGIERQETESSRTIRQLESALQSNVSLTKSTPSRRSSKTSRSHRSSSMSTQTKNTETNSIATPCKSSSIVCTVQKLVHANSMPCERRTSKSSSPSRITDLSDRPASTPSPRMPSYNGETRFQRPSFNLPRPHCPISRAKSDQKSSTTRSVSAHQVKETEAHSLHSESFSLKRVSKFKRFLSLKKGLRRRESL